MKTTYFVQITLAAALALAGSVAMFAQSGSMTAKVDFPFRATTADMASGHYELRHENISGVPRFYLRNADTHKQIILIVHAVKTVKPDRPSMTFRCVSAGCGLTEITSWNGQVYQTGAPKYTSAEKERLVTVYLDRTAGE